MISDRVRAIISDLDKTLLRTDQSLSSRVLTALEGCRSAGILIGIATARSEIAASSYIGQVNPDFLVVNGGALAKSKNEVIYRKPLSAKITNSLVDDMLKIEGIAKITVETDRGYYANFHYTEFPAYQHAQYNDFGKPIDAEAYKIVVECSDDVILGELAAKYGDCSVMHFSGENWHGFAHRNATKWAAIAVLLRHLELSPRNVCSFGDDHNDVEMIQESGVGVAVSNGIDEIKGKAQYVTECNDEDGVASFIEKYLL